MNEVFSSDPKSGATSTPRLKNDASNMKERVSESAIEAGATLKQSTHDAAESVKEAGTEAAHKLQEQTRSYAQSRKTELGERIKDKGESFRRAAEKLRDDNDPNIAKYAQIVAEKIENAGEYVRSSDFNTIKRDLEVAARRRPEIVFGGMFVLGLAISRFLKASSRDETHEAYQVMDESDYEPVQAYETDEHWEPNPSSPPVSEVNPPLGTPHQII